MSRHIAPVIGLIAALAPTLAFAQTNIDADKTPAQIFANDCAACHKSARGLGAGRGSLMLSSFLREHYTSSKEQAAALAAYVLGAGGGESSPATQGRGQKPAPEQAKSTGEERKPTGHPARETAKREEHAPATAKLQPSADEDRKPLREPRIMAEPNPDIPGHKPVAARHEPTLGIREGHRNELEAAPPSPEPVAAPSSPPSVPEPVVHENPPPSPEAPPPEPVSSHSAAAPENPPEPAPSHSAAAPENSSEPGDNAPAARDNIPD